MEKDIKQVKLEKIAFLISSFRAGGGEKQVIEIANAFATNGYKVDLLVLKLVGELEGDINPEVNIKSLDRKRISLSIFPLIKYLKNERPAVLVTLDEFTHPLALIAKKLTKTETRFILRIGNMLSELSKRFEGRAKILPLLMKKLYKNADHIIANSKGVRDDIITFTGIEASRVTVIYNPKPIGAILEKSKEKISHGWFEKKELPIILFSGRLRVQKNISLLVRAFAKVITTTPARLIIVGAGRDEVSLRLLIKNLNIEEKVSMVGYAKNPYAWMAGADIFVYPSLWEGMPNSVLEAMVCGLPIIAADCSSGPREILAPQTDYRIRLKQGLELGEFGILTAVNDEGALEQALRKLLSDSALRKEYALKSIKRSKDFDSHDSIAQYENVVCDLH